MNVNLNKKQLTKLVENITNQVGNLYAEEIENNVSYLTNSIKNLIAEFESENDGNVIYVMNRLKKIIEPFEPLSEQIINEWRPSTGFDTWADLETGNAHSRGVQNRKNFTRKENAKQEKVTNLNKLSDFLNLILSWGTEGDLYAEKLFKILVSKYKKGILTLSDLNKISLFDPIKDREVVKLVSDFVKEEEAKTNQFGWNVSKK